MMNNLYSQCKFIYQLWQLLIVKFCNYNIQGGHAHILGHSICEVGRGGDRDR